MKIKKFNVGEKVILQTKSKSWEGHILESHDSEIVLLKLNSGYNIGIREREILDAQIIEKTKTKTKQVFNPEIKENLKNIAMIITGGTISSRLDSKTGAVISTDAEDILNIAPEIRKICNLVKIESPFMKLSEEMDPKDWKKIAETAEKLLNDESIDGLIISHGTDTLSYTASALSFFLRDLNKPIALTYSQRSVDRSSTDAHLNLICAAKYAINDIAEIAIIGHKDSSDEKCLAMPATKTRKMHSSKRDAFKPINSKPIAEIDKENFKILKEFNARNNKKIKLDAKYLNKVATIKIHPGKNPAIIDYYMEKGYKGLILELTGLGNIPGKNSENNWLPKIKNAIQNGVTICATPQTIYGRLNPNVYSTGRNLQKTKIIFLEDMLTETALIKLGWVLAHSKWDVKEKMLENISGEFNDKIEF